MRLVLIDLIPALLMWEGRDAYDVAAVRSGAPEAIHDLFTDFRLAGLTDGDKPASVVREALERLELAPYFDSIGTSSAFGPQVTPRIVRRVVGALGATGQAIVVTGRPELADSLHMAGIPVVPAGDDPAEVPAAVRRMAYGRVNP